MIWSRGFGSARFDHFFQERAERFGLLEVDVVAGIGNDTARDRAPGFRLKDGEDLAVFDVTLPRQVAYADTLRRQLAKRVNRLALQRHLMGACALEGEREQFRVVGKAARPESFSLFIGQVALAFEQGQARPPVHESGHPFVSHTRRPREVALAQRFTRGVVDRPEPRAFENEGCDRIQTASSTARSEGCGASEHSAVEIAAPPRAIRSHVKAASSVAWSEGCGASERNATELVAAPQVARNRIQAASSIARSEGCGASERSATELAVPQVVRSKARRLKCHAPAHGVPNQNGRHTCIARNGPAESQKRPRLEAQIEEARALRRAVASRAGAHSMPRKLEAEAPSPHIRKESRRIVPGRSLLREAVNEHDRDRRGATFPRARR